MVIINVALDFTRYPSGRFSKFGTTSGERFRDKFLIPPITAGEQVVVQLDGTLGYGSSFLEEAFGGIVRVTGLRADRIIALIKLETDDEALKAEIIQYIRDAKNVQATN